MVFPAFCCLQTGLRPRSQVRHCSTHGHLEVNIPSVQMGEEHRCLDGQSCPIRKLGGALKHHDDTQAIFVPLSRRHFQCFAMKSTMRNLPTARQRELQSHDFTGWPELGQKSLPTICHLRRNVRHAFAKHLCNGFQESFPTLVAIAASVSWKQGEERHNTGRPGRARADVQHQAPTLFIEVALRPLDPHLGEGLVECLHKLL
mmetsp:Transcript_34200/g.72826  ORF Transcript_34200/g.72826 Transcript_34200/m.72826 type:complete len:202 (+) Transcript_34200:1188-1793(+)